MIERYSADAVRYWAASTALGKDAVIDEQRIQAGAKLATKLWNVARFSQRFLAGFQPKNKDKAEILSPADRWILARTAQVVERSTELWEQYDYASARSEVEIFFWRDLADNYLETVKKRLYDDVESEGARLALHHALLATVKLFAPIMPFVTERIFQGLFAESDMDESIHRSSWPKARKTWIDEDALAFGEVLLAIATTVRRFKSETNRSLGAELQAIHLATADAGLAANLAAAHLDLAGLTRAQDITVSTKLHGDGIELSLDGVRLLRLVVVP
jgi:valyl-tRNA synthetase